MSFHPNDVARRARAATWISVGLVVFLVGAWTFVLGLTFWSFYRLLRSDPSKEQLPPPGSIP